MTESPIASRFLDLTTTHRGESVTDLTVHSIALLTYVPPLRLKPCCATPGNAVRKPEEHEVVSWLTERGYSVSKPSQPVAYPPDHHPV